MPRAARLISRLPRVLPILQIEEEDAATAGLAAIA
jgi:hypothetical protein